MDPGTPAASPKRNGAPGIVWPVPEQNRVQDRHRGGQTLRRNAGTFWRRKTLSDAPVRPEDPDDRPEDLYHAGQYGSDQGPYPAADGSGRHAAGIRGKRPGDLEEGQRAG